MTIDGKGPWFSIVVPVCDRHAAVEKLLGVFAPGAQRSLSNADGEHYEFIVADDSKDERLLRALIAQVGWVRYVRGPRRGAGANRNAGAAAARGRWLVFLDDDCVVGSDYLAALHACIIDTRAQVIEGMIVCPDKTGWPWRSEPENHSGGFFWSGNLAVERSVFAQLGGFDPQLGRGEDIYFGHCVRAHGLRTAFCAGALAQHHSDRLSMKKYFDRVLSARWQLLVRLKCAGSPPRDIGWAACARAVVRQWLSIVLRQCWVPLRDALRERSLPPVAILFGAWVNLAWLPVMLPYLIFWEREYRVLLRKTSPVGTFSR